MFLPDYCIALNHKRVCLDFVEPYGIFKNVSGEYKQGLSSYSKDFFLKLTDIGYDEIYRY